jgi:integral membrane protein (TIGR01906 family)
MNPILTRIMSWLVALIVPFFLLMTAIRLLFTPLYPQIVYHLPGFPADTFGFTMQERLHWSKISIDYLLNDAGIEYLSRESISSGQPLYNERELSHMLDVKRVYQKMIAAWTILLGLLVIFGLWGWRAKWLPAFIHGLSRGGQLTIVLVILILLATVTSFDALFTAFHKLFFTGNTWLFLYSDTLIRLFPLPFWEIGFIVMGTFTIVGAVLLILLERRFVR